MNTAASAAILLPKAAAWARGAIRRDRANAYALLEPWTLPPLGGDLPRLGLMPPAEYADERIVVTRSHGDTETSGALRDSVPPCETWTITVLPWELDSRECDGCTMAPDSWGDLRLYVAALFHDRWYLSMESIAERWGWPVKRVRRLGDIVFATLIRSLATGLPWASRQRARLAAWAYYRAVRAFGGIAHRAMRSDGLTVGRSDGLTDGQTDRQTDQTSSSPGGGGGISPRSTSSIAPVALAGLFLSLGAGCSGGCSEWAWSDDIGLYRLEEPAVAFTNTVTGEHWEVGRSDGQTVGRSDRETKEDAE